MITKIIPRAAIFSLLLLIFMSIGTAVATSNTVPGTHVGRTTQTINANALKPAACAALNLTAIYVCPNGTCNATDASELIIGNANGRQIRGQGGDDCILAGGGNDTLDGGTGNDVCIGEPGTDTFTNCETMIQDDPP